jgi:hypothetical protein
VQNKLRQFGSVAANTTSIHQAACCKACANEPAVTFLLWSAAVHTQVCIFAYGQTGSGKTYTMFGNDENRGIIPRAMAQVRADAGDTNNLLRIVGSMHDLRGCCSFR